MLWRGYFIRVRGATRDAGDAISRSKGPTKCVFRVQLPRHQQEGWAHDLTGKTSPLGLVLDFAMGPHTAPRLEAGWGGTSPGSQGRIEDVEEEGWHHVVWQVSKDCSVVRGDGEEGHSWSIEVCQIVRGGEGADRRGEVSDVEDLTGGDEGLSDGWSRCVDGPTRLQNPFFPNA